MLVYYSFYYYHLFSIKINKTLPYLNNLKWIYVTHFLSLLQNVSSTNHKLYNIHFFSALTLGLKKDDIGFMPVLSTLARVFWAAVIFLGGWNKRRDEKNQYDNSTTLYRENREVVTKQGKLCWPTRVMYPQSLKKQLH